LGNEVEILGEEYDVTGLSEGTLSLVNSVAFISMDDFDNMRGSYNTFSFLLVKVVEGESPEAVADRIEAQVRDVTAQTMNNFAAQERRVVKDMSTDVITIMNLIGFLIGLAVMALTVYTSTLSRRREYGMLKALGARNGDLYITVLAQAILSVMLGFLFGLTFTFMLTKVASVFGSNMTLEISLISLLKVGSVSFMIAIISAMIPIRQIAGLDPAMVFRRQIMINTSSHGETLQIAHVTKRYGSGSTEVTAVRDVSLSVSPGEIVLIGALPVQAKPHCFHAWRFTQAD
jgi:putative ABC transport system permease protein